MTGRRWRVFPIAVALVATTLAGCTAQDAPFGIGITGYDPTLPDIPRGFSWEGPARPKGRMSRSEVEEHRWAVVVGHLYGAIDAVADARQTPIDPSTGDPMTYEKWNEIWNKLNPSPCCGH
jgi:hypothetical protein